MYFPAGRDMSSWTDEHAKQSSSRAGRLISQKLCLCVFVPDADGAAGAKYDIVVDEDFTV